MMEKEKMCVHARKGREACEDVDETQARPKRNTGVCAVGTQQQQQSKHQKDKKH